MVVPQRLSVEAGIPSGPGANEGFSLSIAFETAYSSMTGTFDNASAICLSSVTVGRKVAAKREAKISHTADGEFCVLFSKLKSLQSEKKDFLVFGISDRLVLLNDTLKGWC